MGDGSLCVESQLRQLHNGIHGESVIEYTQNSQL